jgi:quercetin 2,3-dioxygenase
LCKLKKLLSPESFQSLYASPYKNEALTFELIKSNTMKTTLYRAEERGHSNFGWLDAHYTFSFSNYYDPERMSFGMLRVLNDDVIAPGAGLKEHAHDNMEIISIPLAGVLAHKDSTGHEEVLYANDIQLMSTGKGLKHSEYNFSHQDAVNFLQLWIFPKDRNTLPRYEKKHFEPEQQMNELMNIIAPEENGSLKINQQAWLYLGKFDREQVVEYTLKGKDNGLFVFVIKGEAQIGLDKLHDRDGVGICEADQASFKAMPGASLLVVEVPMH